MRLLYSCWLLLPLFGRWATVMPPCTGALTPLEMKFILSVRVRVQKGDVTEQPESGAEGVLSDSRTIIVESNPVN